MVKNAKAKTQKPKLRVKTGDTVRVLRGKDRGKKGKILAVFPREERVLVEGISMVFRHVRPRRAGEKGQRVQVAAPVPVSRVQLVCSSCKKGTRVGVRFEGDTRVRFCKQCEAVIE
ncbi:MAG: 50S ribosomal protein L24 [Patescibacteria group bacterium]